MPIDIAAHSSLQKRVSLILGSAEGSKILEGSEILVARRWTNEREIGFGAGAANKDLLRAG